MCLIWVVTDRHGHDRMVIGFTTYATSTYHQ